MPRPCSCDNVIPQSNWDTTQCRLCWFYHHNERVRKAWDDEELELPTILEQGATLAKAVTKWMFSGCARVPLEVTESRLKICEVCDLRKDDKCGVCGCFINKKATWTTESCPVGKWGAHGSESAGPSTPPGGPTPGGDTGGDTFTHQVDG